MTNETQKPAAPASNPAPSPQQNPQQTQTQGDGKSNADKSGGQQK